MGSHQLTISSVLVLLSMLFVLSSCEKETEDGEAKELNYNGKSYALTYATLGGAPLAPDSYEYAIELWDATNLLKNFNGEMHLLYFRIKGTSEELQSGTYPLVEANQSLAPASLLLGTATDPANVRRFNFSSGEIIVDRNGNYYKFTITLYDAEGKLAAGYYAGILEEGDGDGDWDD